MVGGRSYVGLDGALKQVSAGLPANLSGPIHLCMRGDANQKRHFDGRIAYLGTLQRSSPIQSYERDRERERQNSINSMAASLVLLDCLAL